jgi:hypothetical protein
VDWPLEAVDGVTMDFSTSAQTGDVDLLMPQAMPPVPVRLNGRPPVPEAEAQRAALPPHGVRHRYALLACAYYLPQSGAWNPQDLRRILHLCDEPVKQTAEPPKPPPPPPPADEPQKDLEIAGLASGPGAVRMPLDLLKHVAVAEDPKAKAIREVKEAEKEADKVRSQEAAKLLTEKLAASSLLKVQPGATLEKGGGAAAQPVKKTPAKKGKKNPA